MNLVLDQRLNSSFETSSQPPEVFNPEVQDHEVFEIGQDEDQLVIPDLWSEIDSEITGNLEDAFDG